jgi:hypothetical protein
MVTSFLISRLDFVSGISLLGTMWSQTSIYVMLFALIFYLAPASVLIHFSLVAHGNYTLAYMAFLAASIVYKFLATHIE